MMSMLLVTTHVTVFRDFCYRLDSVVTHDVFVVNHGVFVVNHGVFVVNATEGGRGSEGQKINKVILKDLVEIINLLKRC